MEIILPIMLATSPIWLLLGFIAYLIARDYETLRSERFKRMRKDKDYWRWEESEVADDRG